MSEINSNEDQKTAEASKSTLNDLLSASEAVFGLLGWLTTRKTPVTFSGTHDAGIAAELAEQFCNENNLAPPRNDWHLNLIHPAGEIAISGRGKNITGDKEEDGRPVNTGLYLYSCDELEGEWDHAAITYDDGILWVHDDGGVTPLDYFHSNLTNIKWQRVA